MNLTSIERRIIEIPYWGKQRTKEIQQTVSEIK